MIKAEVIAHDGYEVPNWLTKCHDVLTSLPVIGTVALLLIVGAGVFVWHARQVTTPAETSIQSQPPTSTDLRVVSSDNLPVPAASTVTPAVTNVGPAATTSGASLQPTGLNQNSSSGLSQTAQSIQNAGQAANGAVGSLEL